MSIRKIKQITSVCRTPKEFISSDDFINGLNIILSQVKNFDRDYILSLFINLKKGKILSEKEKEQLINFLRDDKVLKKLQELLGKLNNVRVNFQFNNSLSDLNSFSELLNNIFAEDGYKKVLNYIGEVADIVRLTLNAYEGFTKLQIDVNGEKREIYLENENLRVDSSNWKQIKIGGLRIKINPEGDITEYLEGDLAGHQLFTQKAAEREAKKLGKRLPGNIEYQAILKKLGHSEFTKHFTGYRLSDGSDFLHTGRFVGFWSSSNYGNNSYIISFIKGSFDYQKYLEDVSKGLSVRCVKD